MNRLIHGIVRGNTIEVNEEIGLSDGQAVDLIVVFVDSSTLPHTNGANLPKKAPGPPPGWKPGIASATAGALAAEWTDEDDRIFEQIQTDRKAAKWRELPP